MSQKYRRIKEYLIQFLKEETFKTGLNGGVLALDFSVESAVVAILAKEAFGNRLLVFVTEAEPENSSLQTFCEARDIRRFTLSESEIGATYPFLEGADIIAKHHAYTLSFEEKMFMLTREQVQRMEGVLKYYLAAEIFQDDPQMKKKMQRAVERFDRNLQQFNQYRYDSKTLSRTKERLLKSWEVAKSYLRAPDKHPLPLVLNVGGVHIEMLFNVLGIYHSKNQ